MWQSLGGDHKNQIDFMLVKSRWKTCIENSRIYLGPNCGSDHNLVGAIVRLKIKRNEFTSRTLKIILDISNTLMMKETYTVQVNSRFTALKILDEWRSSSELFNVFEREQS